MMFGLSRNTARKLTNEQIAQAAAKYDAGVGPTELARRYGVSVSSMNTYLAHATTLRGTTKKKKFTEEQVARAAAEYDAGASLEVVARRYGTSKSVIRDWIDRVTEVRPPGRKGKILTGEQVAQIAAQYDAGVSPIELARHYGVSAQRLYKLIGQVTAMRPAGGRKQRLSGKEVTEAVFMFLDGMSVSEIDQSFGSQPGVVQRHLFPETGGHSLLEYRAPDGGLNERGKEKVLDLYLTGASVPEIKKVVRVPEFMVFDVLEEVEEDTWGMRLQHAVNWMRSVAGKYSSWRVLAHAAAEDFSLAPEGELASEQVKMYARHFWELHHGPEKKRQRARPTVVDEEATMEGIVRQLYWLAREDLFRKRVNYTKRRHFYEEELPELEAIRVQAEDLFQQAKNLSPKKGLWKKGHWKVRAAYKNVLDGFDAAVALLYSANPVRSDTNSATSLLAVASLTALAVGVWGWTRSLR